MFYYKKIIKSGDMLEIEYYKSIRKRGQKNNTRSCKKCESSKKQKIFNEIAAKKKCQRLIANNFVPGDQYITMTFKDDMTQKEANNAVTNFIRRLKRYRAKNNLPPLKYIGCIECGKRGNRWHAHFVINKTDFDVVTKLWGLGRLYVENLYKDGNYADLAKYITKDVTGQRRLKQSKNLIQPTEKVKEMSKKEIKAIENFIVPDFGKKIDEEYILNAAVSETRYNDITGLSAYFVFNRQEKANQRRGIT